MEQKIYGNFLNRNLLVIDSIQFMSSSLDKLVKNLPDGYFKQFLKKTQVKMADEATLQTEERLATLIGKNNSKST